MSRPITEAFLQLAHALRVSGFDPKDFAVSVRSKKYWEFVSMAASETSGAGYPTEDRCAMLKERMK